jgi:UDP-glucose 4-epimerase
MTRFFIVGGAGFIGSHLVDALIGRYGVTVYDNLSSGQLAFISRHRGNPRFSFVRGDCGDLKRLRRAMAGHDAVIHLASNPDIARSLRETDLDLREGTLLTFNVLEAMRLTGAKTILYASGSGVYGDTGRLPTPEDFGPLLPISLYGASKLAGEGLASAFSHMFDLRANIFRFANVVGARQTHGVAFDFIRRLRKDPRVLDVLGDGRQSKSYLHVSDAVSAMLMSLRRGRERVNVFNVATGDYLSVSAIARLVIVEMGLAGVNVRYAGGARGWKGDVPVVRFDLKKILHLGWRPRHNSAEAMRRSIREMLAQKNSDQ